MSHLPEGNRKSALDVLAENPKLDSSVVHRPAAWREIIAETKRGQAQVRRRTEDMRRLFLRYQTERQRAAEAQQVSEQRLAPVQQETPGVHIFEPIPSQRPGIRV